VSSFSFNPQLSGFILPNTAALLLGEDKESNNNDTAFSRTLVLVKMWSTTDITSEKARFVVQFTRRLFFIWLLLLLEAAPRTKK